MTVLPQSPSRPSREKTPEDAPDILRRRHAAGPFVHTAQRLVGFLNRMISICAAILLGLLLVLVLVSVGLRYLFGTGFVGIEEASIWLFLGLISMGMPAALRGPLSMRLDCLVRAMPPGLSKLTNVGADAVTAMAGFIFIFGGSEIAIVVRSVSPVLGIPDMFRTIFFVVGGVFLVTILFLQRVAERETVAAIVSLVIALLATEMLPLMEMQTDWPVSVIAAISAGIGFLFGAPLAHCLLAGVFLAFPFGSGLTTAAILSSAASGMSKFLLLAIPFFLLAGVMLTLSGAGARLVHLAETIVGHRKAGLAQTALLTGVFFSGASGSSVANAAFGASTFHPHLVRHGYPAEKSAAVIAATAILDNVIPPSIALLLLAAVTDLSVGALLIGGAYAGLLMAICLAVAIRVTNGDSARRIPAGFAERRAAFFKAIPALGLVIVVVSGIRFGVVTMTEAAALAGGYALLLSIAGGAEWRNLGTGFCQCAVESAAIGILIGAATPFAFLLAIDDIAGAVRGLLTMFGDEPWQILLLCNLILLAAGLVIDTGAAILLLGPILVPVAVAVDLDPIWFGIILIINLLIGGLTPPVGVLLLIVSGLTGVSAPMLFRAVVPYLIALLTSLLILCLLALIF